MCRIAQKCIHLVELVRWRETRSVDGAVGSGLLMIGMVLVTHGQLANGFRAALEHVVGPQSQFETIAIGPEDDMEQRRSDILDAASRVQDGSGVVLLTDMFGGTPSNLAISAMEARDAGRKYITVASKVLTGK